MTSPALAERLDGLLFFPVTAFGPDGGLDLDAFRAHVRRAWTPERQRSSHAAARVSSTR